MLRHLCEQRVKLKSLPYLIDSSKNTANGESVIKKLLYNIIGQEDVCALWCVNDGCNEAKGVAAEEP